MASATLADYARFHRMLVGPAAARRCVESFEGGVVVFAPAAANTPAAFPPRGKSAFDLAGSLSVFSYYFLVATSFTGLSTLLGLTTTFVATEDRDGLDRAGRLDPDPAVVAYVARRAGATARRRVESIRP